MRILVSLLLLVFVSCTTIYFEEPQPQGIENQKVIPADLHGRYRLSHANDEAWIEIAHNYIFRQDDSSYVSDSLIIRKFNDHYIVSTQKPDIKNHWEVLVLRKNACSNLKVSTFIIPNNDNKKTNIELAKTEFKAVEFKWANGNNQEKVLLINPSQTEFRKLMDSQLKVGFLLENVSDKE